jgi:hypothetical protein
MRVDVVRSGGIAGITRRAPLDTSALDPSERATVEDALRALPFHDHHDLPSHPDEFRYTISVPETGDAGEFWESELPRELKTAIGNALRST